MNNAGANNSTIGLAELAEELSRNGVVFLQTRCKPAVLETVRKVSRVRSREIRDALGANNIGIGSAAGYLEIVQRSPGRWDVPISFEHFGIDDNTAPWWPLITAILGVDAERAFSGVVSSDPGSPAQYWHTDSPHESFEHQPAHALNVLLALQDTSMLMGPTEFACGSHFLTNHLRNEALVLSKLIYQHADTSPETLVRDDRLELPKRIALEMTAGSCVVFDDRLMHRGLGNRSDVDRHIAYFSYRRKGYIGETHFESQQSLLDAAGNRPD